MSRLCSILLLLTAAVFAQTNATDAAVDGYLLDPSGGAIAGGKVTLRNLRTNELLEIQSNSDGYYRFPLVKVGGYELTAAAPGFSEYKQTGLTLSVGQKARLDVSLKVGSATESVTVASDISVVEAGGQTAQGEVLNEQAIRSLPITSRNLYNFHLIGPGVKGIPSTGFGTTNFLFGGLNRTTWTVDGLDNSQRRFNRQIRLVISTPESVQEMQVMSGGYSAEFGRASGGVINVVSRSGTNELHGSGMGLYRPKETAARPPLNATRPNQTWWMVAGNLGGAIKKDRLWYFINSEYNPLKIPSPVTINRDAARQIGLSERDLRDSPFGETFHTPSGKMNFRLSDRHSGFLRYNRFTNDQPAGGAGLTIPDRTVTFEDRMNGGAAQLASVLKPNLLNELRFGINRRSELREPVGRADANGFHVNITGVANIGVNPLSGSSSVENSTQIIDNVTWTAGKHTVKAGFDFQTTGYGLTNAFARAFTFGGLTAGARRGAVTPLDQYVRTVRGEIDPESGRPYTYTQLTQDIGDRNVGLRFNFLNFFAQDEWRLNRRFTLNIGLRYELVLFPTFDAQAPFELSRGVNNDTNNFAPRFGFSWQPFNDSRTVVRGGYGIYYDSPSLQLPLNAAQFNGRRVLSYVVPGTSPTAPPFGQLLTGGVAAFQQTPSVNAFARDFQIMFGHNANFMIEREVVRNLSINLQYSWWAHRFGPYTRDINLSAPVRTLADGRPVYQGTAGRPNPLFRQINLLESGSNSNYNALDLTARKRFASGLQFSGTWSWSKALSDTDLQGGALSNPADRRFDYGNSNGDIRHSFNAQALWAPRFQSAAIKWVNGFEFSSMSWWNSGFRVNAVAGTDLNNDLVLNDRLPGRSRNSFAARDYFQVDFRLARRIPIREKHFLELIAESENLFNRLNANCGTEGCSGAVVNRDGALDLLRITSARQGRQFQFGMRYSF